MLFLVLQLICCGGVHSLEATGLLGPTVAGHIGNLLLSFTTSAFWHRSPGPCWLQVEINSQNWQLASNSNGSGCPFLAEVPGFPAPQSCDRENSSFQLYFLGCLVKNHSYHMVLQVKAETSASTQLGSVTLALRSASERENVTVEVEGEIRSKAQGSLVAFLMVQHVPQYMDVRAFQGDWVSLIVQINRHYTPIAGEILVLSPSPLTLWMSQLEPGAGTCVALRWNSTGGPLVCSQTALGFLVEVEQLDIFELQLRLPRGGETGLRPWRGWLMNSSSSAVSMLEAPVVLGPHQRAAVRSTTVMASRGLLRLEMDVGADLCIVDSSWVPGEVLVRPPLTLELPQAFSEEPGVVLPPVDCIWKADAGICTMTMIQSQWKRGLHCFYRGVVYTLQWEITNIAVITKSSGWQLEMTYPVPLDGSISESSWSSDVATLPSSFGTLPFLAAQSLRPVLGGQHQAETLLLVRFATGTSLGYQDLLPLSRASKLRLLWNKGIAFANFDRCNDLILETRNLPRMSSCKVAPWQRAPVDLELHFDGVLQSEETYDLVVPVIVYFQEVGTLRLEVRREDASDDASSGMVEWGEVITPDVLPGDALFDELGSLLPEVQVFPIDEDVLGLSPWENQLLVTTPGKLKFMEVDLPGDPQETWQQPCDDLISSCQAGAVSLLASPELLLCDGTRLLRLELTPLGNETFMRLIGRFGNSLAQLGREGLGRCKDVSSSLRPTASMAQREDLRIFVVDESNHRVLQLKALETASSKASSVLLPAAEDLAVSYPLEVIYGYDHYELMVGQQGEGPLPARLWRVRLADMELLGFVFLQLSSNTDPNQIALKNIDILTAMAVGSDSIWVAGELRLLLRLNVATLRSTDSLTLLPSWGRVTVMQEYNNILVLGTSQPALVIQVPLTSTTLNSAVPQVWTLTPAQGTPTVATTMVRTADAIEIAVLGTDAEPPQLLLLPSETSLALPGKRITALAPLLPFTGSIDGDMVLVATGEGNGVLAALHLVQLGQFCAERTSTSTTTVTTDPNATGDDFLDEANITEECDSPNIFLNAWESDITQLQISSIIQDGASLHVSLMQGDVNDPRSFTARFLLEGHSLELEDNSTTFEGGRLVLVQSADGLRTLLVRPNANSRFSIFTLDTTFAPQGLSLVSVFGRRVAGPLEVGYTATSGNDGLSSPCGVAYSELPEPCLYIVDTGNHRLVQLSVSLTTMRYVTHFGESGFRGASFTRLDTPKGVALGDGFRVYVLDDGNARILVLSTGETLGRLTMIQRLVVPMAASFMTLLPGRGLGSSTLWLASTRHLMRWTFAPPAQWEIGSPPVAEAVAPLEIDVTLTEGQLMPGVGGGLLITAAPALTWQLPPASPLLSVPPPCQAEVMVLPGGSWQPLTCDFLSAGPGLPSVSLLLHVERLDAAEQRRFSVRCALPSGVAPNILDLRSMWMVALLGQGWAGNLRSRLLPLPALPAVAVPVTPQVIRPLVVQPPQGAARLGFDLTVHAILKPHALLVGSADEPGELAVHFPPGFVLQAAGGCEVVLNDRCVIALGEGVRLQADASYLLRLELLAPAGPLLSTQWTVNFETSGPLKATGSVEVEGVSFTLGTLIPSSWTYFPSVEASPLKLGPALVLATFRPYTNGTRSVIIVGPDTTGLSCRKMVFMAFSETPNIFAADMHRCLAALSFAKIDLEEELNASVTYQVQFEVQHFPGSWIPEADEVLRVLAEGNKSKPCWWRISFEDGDGHALATAQWIPGYPVWPESFTLQLAFLTLPMAPLPPGRQSMLEVTLSSLQGLTTKVAPLHITLDAPQGFIFGCDFSEAPALEAVSAMVPTIPLEAGCRGLEILQLTTLQALTEDMNYSFRIPVTLPSTLGDVDAWYGTLQAGSESLGTVVKLSRPVAVTVEFVEEEEAEDADTTGAIETSTPAPAPAPAMTTSGYLHVDQLVVTEATEADATSPLGQWLLEQSWASIGDLLSLELRQVQVEGLSIGTVLAAGGVIRLLAPPGYAFRQPFDPTTILVDLPLAESLSTQRQLDLYFQGDLDTNALDLAVAVVAVAGSERMEPWQLELWSATGELLGRQGNVGSFDRSQAFGRSMVTTTSAAQGHEFQMFVFLVLPDEVSLNASSHGSSFLRLQAPASLNFAACGPADVLSRVPSEVVGALQDKLTTQVTTTPEPESNVTSDDGNVSDVSTTTTSTPYLGLTDSELASLWPLPNFSCSAGANVLTIYLDGPLHAGAVYGFAWRARQVVGRQEPWRPQDRAGFAGAGSELLQGDEAATIRLRDSSWRVEGFIGERRLLTSSVDHIQLLASEVSPVWLHAPRPYYAQESLLLIVFALGGRSFPPSKLRLVLSPSASGDDIGMLFLDCERQLSLLRRQQWQSPLNLQEVPLPVEVNNTPWPLEGQLTMIRLLGCRGGSKESNEDVAVDEGNNESVPDLWLPSGENRLNLSLDTWLTPPGEQYLLQLGVAHAPKILDSEMPLLTIEIFESTARSTAAPALARTADLRTYAVAQEMTLIQWSYSSSFRSAENALVVEFQPFTTTSERKAEMLGFLLVAPPTYVFTKKSCEEFVLGRSELVENLQTGRMESKPLFLKEMPLCEVMTSEWLGGGGYYQHQLAIYLPPLVGFRKEFRYRLQVTILNPPLPLNDALMMSFLQQKHRSPKYSTSKYLAPSINTWRVSTFFWNSGDAGTGEVPFSLRNSGPLGRFGGISKVDEVAWKGFDLT